MNINRNDLMEILRRYHTGIVYLDDVSDAIWLVHDLMEAEIKATKEQEPYATRYIDRMTEVMHELVSMDCEVSDMLDDIRLEQKPVQDGKIRLNYEKEA